MKASEIRSTYLEFFRERGHRIFPSASLIPEDPRAPLLTTAGMVQFIPYFYGERSLDPPRAASCQVVARTTDIEVVGLDARHQSVYEMLGNFAFGDYFKEESIRWAWELSTGPFGLDGERIWVTIFEHDDEAFAIWRDAIGLPEHKIIRRGKADNFWWIEGVSGPGGPNTELFYDRGPAYGHVEGFQDGDRIMEYWNLVFTQFEVDPSGDPVRDLPKRNVDTGLGLERLAQILQEVPTAYETDSFRQILAMAESVTGTRYGDDEKADISLRIVTEHLRAATFMVSDGIVPSNEGRGYVLRRILRRAIRRSKMLGVDRLIAPQMIEAVVETLGEAYPKLISERAFIETQLLGEEESFRGTLSRGLVLLEDKITGSAQGRVSGDVAFKLHDTYGFPFELTLEIAQEAGLDIDRESFEALMGEQRDRARAARKEIEISDVEALREVLASHGASTFVGYERGEDEAKVLAIVKDGAIVGSAREGDEVEVILDVTPFYPEGGGQIGDAGIVTADGARAEVADTQRRLGELIVHLATVSSGELVAGSGVRAVVDRERRTATMRSHTATHILHALLREALGEHARQAGSLVAPGRLRFDFNHARAVPPEVLDDVEARANAHLLGDEPVRPYETTMEEARNRGALMLFEEKYGDIVRVVEVGDYSIELCGGTHVERTSQIGAVKLLGEASIGSNLRRVEALTGADAIGDFRRSRALLEHVGTLLRTDPEEAPGRVEKLLADLKAAEQQIRKAQAAGQRERAGELAGRAERLGQTGVVITEVPGLDASELQKLAVAVRDAVGSPAVVVLASGTEGRAGIVAAVDKATVGRGIKAQALIVEAARAIGGGAGGKDEVSIGGGRRPEGIAEALRLSRAAAEELLA